MAITRLSGVAPSRWRAIVLRLNSCVIELVVTKPKRSSRLPFAEAISAARSHQYITKSADLLIFGCAFHNAAA